MRAAARIGLFSVVLVAAAGVAAAQDIGPVGTMSEVAAWTNGMPGPGAAVRLHVIGEIVAPSPCYDVLTEFAGETAAIPSEYRVKVSLRAQEGMCIQALRSIEFHYIAEGYAGNANTVEVMSDVNRVTAPIEPVF